MRAENDRLMRVLFNETDNTCVGGLYDNMVRSPFIAGVSEFFCINPLSNVDHGWEKSKNGDYLTPRRADINVKSFRSFVFECDELGLIDQMDLLLAVEIPWTSIVYSGGKSYHGILSLEEPLGGCHTEEGLKAYKTVWKRLEAKIEHKAREMGFTGKIIDPSGKNPSRFSRTVGFKAEGRLTQTLELLGERVSAEDFSLLLSGCPVVFESSFVNSALRTEFTVGDEEEFWMFCPLGLERLIKEVPFAASAGVYPELLKLLLWGIDSCSPNYDLMVGILEKHTLPKLINAGYSRDKMMVAVEHAYSMKSVGA